MEEQMMNAARHLVEVHKTITEPAMRGALWLPPEPGLGRPLMVWLVEILDSEAEDPIEPAIPFFFNPSKDFQFPLALILGNRSEILAAIRQGEEWTKRLSSAVVLFGEDDVISSLRASQLAAA